jgi:phage tail sheath protein FI
LGALNLLAGLEDVAIIAAPGSTGFADSTKAAAVQSALIEYAQKPRAYRVAVLDTPAGQVLSDVRNLRGQIDSQYAALYYPWVVVTNPNPNGPAELLLPPSGFLCGVYARTDDARGVFKAPANEVVQSAVRFERNINFADQEVLNPLGINCLRFFPGRGYRVWGARTASSDPDWKYISVRRYFIFLEHSIDTGTQWAVFEPNGERLWANVRETISSFLYSQWRAGALLGSDPSQAFFVRCDRTTMTQNDLDNGRLVCLVGVAVVKPAEFVIFRIGQMTADASS